MNRRLSRRAFARIALVLAGGSSIGVASYSAYADQREPPHRIGVLVGAAWPEEIVEAFQRGLLDEGYVIGRDVLIDWRSADGDYGRLPQLAAQLVDNHVRVIVVGGTPATQAAKRVTSTIPIIMVHVADPIGSGLVTNLAHPSENVTGFSLMTPELGVKRLQLLKEAIPRLNRVGVLWNPDTPFHPQVVEQFKALAPSLSMKLIFVAAHRVEDFGAAFSVINTSHAQALYIIDDGFFWGHRTSLLKMAMKARVPVIYGTREFVTEGALIYYGVSLAEQARQSARYIDKILKGAQPSDLPIEQPSKFELVINLRTAQTLGIKVSESMLRRADEVLR